MAQPLVYVLVINWNGREHLHACFESLLAQTYENARFLLLDNGSSDESVSYVRDTFGHDPRVEIVELGENLGWSRGNNVGLEKAVADGADYSFLLNNDTWTAPDAIARLVEVAEADPTLGALAPKMKIYDTPEILNSLGLVCSIIGNTWDLGIGRLDDPKWDTPRDVIGFCGGAALLRMEALAKTGLLPTNYDIYLDDLELSMRLWKHGYRIRSCPEAVVHHKFSATMGREDQRRRKYFLTTRNRLRIVARHFPARHWPTIALALTRGEAKSIGRAALDRSPWMAAAHAQAWFEVVRDLRRTRDERAADPQEYEEKLWQLVDRNHLFFPGTEFPVEGWYRPVTVEGASVRPISRNAHISVQSNRLRLRHANPFPNLGETVVAVVQGGTLIAEVRTRRVEETVLSVEPGAVEFESRRLFDADDTGLGIDVGGWIRAEAGDNA